MILNMCERARNVLARAKCANMPRYTNHRGYFWGVVMNILHFAFNARAIGFKCVAAIMMCSPVPSNYVTIQSQHTT